MLLLRTVMKNILENLERGILIRCHNYSRTYYFSKNRVKTVVRISFIIHDFLNINTFWGMNVF